MGNGTSERILDGAGRLFLQYGYKRTTVDDIATEAGVAKGSVYLHFKSKDDIFGTVCRRLCRQIFADMEAIAAGEGSPEHRLTEMMLRSSLHVWEFCHQAPHAPELWAEVTAAASEYALEAYAEVCRIVAGVIAEGQSQGVFRQEPSADTLAWLIQLAMHAFDPPFMLVDTREKIQQQLPQLMELIVRGMTAELSGSTGDSDV